MNIECMLIGGPYNGVRVTLLGYYASEREIDVFGRQGLATYELGNSGPGYRYHLDLSRKFVAPSNDPPRQRAFVRIDERCGTCGAVIQPDKWTGTSCDCAPKFVTKPDGWVSKA